MINEKCFFYSTQTTGYFRNTIVLNLAKTQDNWFISIVAQALVIVCQIVLLTDTKTLLKILHD